MGRLVAVLVVATLVALVVMDILVGRLAFTTRQDHWAGAYNDPTVERPDRGAPSMVLQVEDLDVSVVVAEGSSADILRGGPGLMSGSPLPGEPGNAVILGRSNRFGGPFAFLSDVGEKTVITVRERAGQVARFEVTDVDVVDGDDIDDVIGEKKPADDAPSTLTLVTSEGGPLDSRRKVVRAELTGRSGGAVVAAPSAEDGDAAASTTTTVADAAAEADEAGADAATVEEVDRDPGTWPSSFDVRAPATIIMLLAGLAVTALGVAAVPELRRRHPTSTVVVVAAPAIALGLVLVLFSIDAVLPVTY